MHVIGFGQNSIIMHLNDPGLLHNSCHWFICVSNLCTYSVCTVLHNHSLLTNILISLAQIKLIIILLQKKIDLAK